MINTLDMVRIAHYNGCKLNIKETKLEVIQNEHINNRMGGKEWVKGEMKRVYLNQELFNNITDFGLKLNDKKWKFYIDQASGNMFRTCGKSPVLEANISDF